MPRPKTTTLKAVKLLRIGTWRASSGVTTFTAEDFDAIIEAAKDPDIDSAPLKIGHVDPNFDGYPALGWVTHLRTDGDYLVGDIEDVPEPLAEILPKAYKRRSSEVAWGVRTPGGKTYRAALVGLALLGKAAPAVKGLGDLVDLYGIDKATKVSAASELTYASTSSFALDDDVDDPNRAAILVGAQAAVSALALLAGADEETTTAALEAVEELANGESQKNPSPPGTGVDNEKHTPAETAQEGRMGKTLTEDKIRELLAKEDDVDVDATLTSLRSTAASGTGEGNGSTETGKPAEGTKPEGQEGKPAEGTKPEGQEGKPAEGTKPEGEAKPEGSAEAGKTPEGQEPETVTLSAGQWAKIQEDIKAGTSAHARIRKDDVDATIKTALSEGRIAPADVDDQPAKDGKPARKGWRSMLEADFDGTKALLSSLTPAFTTHEVGGDGADVTALSADSAEWDAFEAETFGFEKTASEGGK